MSQDRQFISLDQAQAPFFVGLDLGGTNIKVGVVDDKGQPLSWLTVPTNTEKGAENASARMGAAVKRAISEAGLQPSDIARVGLGSPGTMDLPAGMLIAPVNFKGWDMFPIRDRVAHHSELPVTFANDAAAAAYGEYWVGAGSNFRSLVLFTLGTGIGCGIIISDVSIDGENSHGAECGHMIINDGPEARICGCGQLGHLEAYASATAVIKQMQEALDEGRETSLKRRIDDGAMLTPKLLGEEATAGDAFSRELVFDVARSMGVGIVNLLHTVDPNGVLLGGAMTFGGKDTELGRSFLARIKEEIDQRAFTILSERLSLDFAVLGGDAGYIGAAGLARVDYLNGNGNGQSNGG